MSDLDNFIKSGDLDLSKRIFNDIQEVIQKHEKAESGLTVNQLCFVLSTLMVQIVTSGLPAEFRAEFARHVCAYIDSGVKSSLN